MSFLSNAELKEIGFRYLGSNVKVSSRASIYDASKISIDDNSRIDDFCVLSGKVTVGKNVHIAVNCNLAGGELGITLSDFSGLAYNCNIFTQSDDYSGNTLTNPTVPKMFKNEISKKVVIGRHVIIGVGSVIFPGVHVADGCSIGAMTMVTKNTEEWAIYFGMPARKIKNRSKKLLELEKKYLDTIN